MGNKREHKRQDPLDPDKEESLSGEDSWDFPLFDSENLLDDEEYQEHRAKKSGKRVHRQWTRKDGFEED